MSERFDIVIIGGGASGMAAALAAKQVNPRLSVAVAERQARVGKKLLATGNGRCNLTNVRAVDTACYHGGVSLMKTALKKYPPDVVRDIFSGLGLESREEEAGRVYPESDQAASVVDVLRLSLAEKGVCVAGGFEADAIEKGFFVRSGDGRMFSAKRVIVCCGGPAGEKLGGTRSGHKLLKALGHPISAIYPALCQLKTPPETVRALKGVKYRGDIALIENGKTVQTENGEILFADYGLTGIAAMALCRRAARGIAGGRKMQVRMRLCALPKKTLYDRRGRLPDRLLDDFLTGILPKRMGQQVMKLAGIAPLTRTAASLTDGELDAIYDILDGWTLPVTGTQSLANAQVTAGGADTGYFSPDTLESALVRGLYAAGEVLDIDGDCGGFNLQWAWASGFLAGESAARSLK